jgi:acyl carrier protein
MKIKYDARGFDDISASRGIVAPRPDQRARPSAAAPCPVHSRRPMKTSINTAGPGRHEILDTIADAIRTVSATARNAVITPNSLLLEELALDSLDLVAVILNLQDQFQVEIDPDEIPEMRDVADLAASFASQLRQAA